jgi:hypothetical protein
MMEGKAVLISGKFTQEDLIELIQTLRRIEQRHPEVEYHMIATDPKATMEEHLKFIDEHFPVVPGVPVIKKVIPRPGNN